MTNRPVLGNAIDLDSEGGPDALGHPFGRLDGVIGYHDCEDGRAQLLGGHPAQKLAAKGVDV